MSNCQHDFTKFYLIGQTSQQYCRNFSFFTFPATAAAAMAPHTTNEMRERMVAWHSELGKSDTEIAALANCSERTVREVLRLHRTFGVVRNPFAQPRGGRRSLTTGDLNFISSLLAANPSAKCQFYGKTL